MASACTWDTYPPDLRNWCFGRGRRTPSSQGNNSHRIFFSLPPFASLRSSRPTAESSHSHNQNQSQSERRNEYNDPLNDPSSAWSDYNPMGQQPTFPNDDDSRLQYSYPAPQQVQQPYQSYRDPSSSYANQPTTLPPINVPGNHSRDERWQHIPYGGISPTNRVPETVFSPVAPYPGPPFQYPTQHPTQGMVHDPRFSLPVNPSPITPPSTSTSRRGPVLVESRSSAHATSYPRNPPAPEVSQENPQPPKKKRKRADAEQLRVLNEVYARTAFPSTEERQELAGKLNMTPRSVQIWFQNKRQSMRTTHRQLASVRGTGSDNPSGAHRSGPSRSVAIHSSVSTIPMPHRQGSVGTSTQATYITPSPTEGSYFPPARSSQPQQGASGQSPGRDRGDFNDYYGGGGGGSRRGRV